ALTRESVTHSTDDMVLARAVVGDQVLDRYTEVNNIAKDHVPDLIVLDPAGGVISDLSGIGLVHFSFGQKETFTIGEVGPMATTLSALHAQASLFAESARQRLDGNRGAAYFRRGLGLSNAGLRKKARATFELAENFARNEGDAVDRQRAQLGLAVLDVDEDGHFGAGVKQISLIAREPLTPEIGANAWLLLGDIRSSERGDPKRALEAYAEAYRLAPAGSWAADSARRSLERMGAAPDEGKAASAGGEPVHLIFGRRDVLAGPLQVGATAPENAARVAFLIDDARVTESDLRPFRATLQLGSTPRMHTLRAIAYDVHDRQLGEETVTINDLVERLSVQLVAPKADVIESRTVVEVVPRVPEGEVLEAVEVFWNETKLATLHVPPFRTTLVLPSRRASGYLRAVVVTQAGATAEDAKMINSPAASEMMRVDAVSVYAIVKDHLGHNIEGLKPEDFSVKEDGRPVEVSLRSTPSDPVTVALALDTSGSMLAAMMDVAEDARTFLRGSLAPGDRTLVITFDDQAHLIQPLTADLEHARTEIFAAHAGGATSIWDAMAFALQQLRGVDGKRALLVFTDGLDTGSRTTPSGVRELARDAGVPVYVVLMFTSSRYGDPSPTTLTPREHDYLQLAGESGGAFFRMPKKADLPRLFAQVRDDARGEYLLSFVSKSVKPLGQARRIDVDVPGRHVVIRAPSAYIPR
ncbi:MAG: Ca-activated chloride channel, partial [Thermoanaerobaculia bacterium]|nr:Ca-activated chloride channel [Thermoanaerobaculia bacterium]